MPINLIKSKLSSFAKTLKKMKFDDRTLESTLDTIDFILQAHRVKEVCKHGIVYNSVVSTNLIQAVSQLPEITLSELSAKDRQHLIDVYWSINDKLEQDKNPNSQKILSTSLLKLLDKYPKLIEEPHPKTGDTLLHKSLKQPQKLEFLLERYGKKINVDVRAQAPESQYHEGQGPTLLHVLTEFPMLYFSKKTLYNTLVEKHHLNPNVTVTYSDERGKTVTTDAKRRAQQCESALKNNLSPKSEASVPAARNVQTLLEDSEQDATYGDAEDIESQSHDYGDPQNSI